MYGSNTGPSQPEWRLTSATTTPSTATSHNPPQPSWQANPPLPARPTPNHGGSRPNTSSPVVKNAGANVSPTSNMAGMDPTSWGVKYNRQQFQAPSPPPLPVSVLEYQYTVYTYTWQDYQNLGAFVTNKLPSRDLQARHSPNLSRRILPPVARWMSKGLRRQLQCRQLKMHRIHIRNGARLQLHPINRLISHQHRPRHHLLFLSATRALFLTPAAKRRIIYNLHHILAPSSINLMILPYSSPAHQHQFKPIS